MHYIESESVELKSKYVDSIKKEIIAFANTRDGKVYIGVEDDGEICGVDDPDQVIRQVSNAVRDSIKPDVTMFVSYHAREREDKHIIEVEVQCGSHRPYYLSDKGLRPEGVYIRRGTSSVPASDLAIRKMIKDTDGDSYEEMRSQEQELSFNKLTEEFEKRDMLLGMPQMISLGLADNEGLYSNLALLLSDQCPHIIKAATFEGVDSGSFHDRREFTGSILQQLEDAYAYMDMRNNTTATFEGLLRIDQRDYPEVALREAMLNAIVHRDYSISASTLISIYKNRVEIISIGGLAGGISYDDMMLGISYSRNRNLADVFYRLNLIETYGTGMGKIMGAYSNGATEASPQVQVTTGAFKIVLPNMNQDQGQLSRDQRQFYGHGYASDQGEAELNEGVAKYRKKVLDKEQLLLQLFYSEKRLKRPEVEDALGVSTSTARRILLKLIQKGHIVCEGEGKSSVYVLVE